MNTEQKIRCWVCQRFKEPSTWAALSVPIMTYGSQVHDDDYSNLAFALGGLCGILAVILGERPRRIDYVESTDNVAAEQNTVN